MKIGKWYYINLAHRTDRRTHIESQLGAAGIRPASVQRIEAIKHENGLLGCAHSHIRALEEGLTQGWDWFAILEDDFTIRNPESFLNTIENAPPCDIFLGGLGITDLRVDPISDPYVRVWRSQTTSCYVISKEFAPIVMASFKESIAHTLALGQTVALDQYWKIIQPRAMWIGTQPALGYQRDDYSDIELKHVNYNC